MSELLPETLRLYADALDADAGSSFDRSRRLRESDVQDDYEIGYAEGRQSALVSVARRLREFASRLDGGGAVGA